MLARRRRGLLWSFLALVVVVAVAVGAVVFMRSRRGPTDAEVASTVRAAIEAAVERGTSTTASAPSGGPSDTATGVDTKALRTSLETSLNGWIVDLATDDARTRVGVAARRLDDPVCVLLCDVALRFCFRQDLGSKYTVRLLLDRAIAFMPF